MSDKYQTGKNKTQKSTKKNLTKINLREPTKLVFMEQVFHLILFITTPKVIKMKMKQDQQSG